MRDIAEDRRFPLIELLLTAVAGILWTFSRGELGLTLLPFILVPWFIRYFAGMAPLRKSELDIPVAMFGAAAALAVWSAYDRQMAWGKFWVLLGGILLFLAIVQQSRRNIWLIAACAGPAAAALSIYFMMSHDWRTGPAELEIINRFGGVIMSLRPSLPLPDPFSPQIIAGILTLLLPYILAFGAQSRRHRKSSYFWSTLFFGAVALTGLFLSSALYGWMALGAGLAIWGLFELGERRRWSPRRLLFFLLAALTAITGALFFWLVRVWEPGVINQRLILMRQTWTLVQDFSIIGSGLGTFPAIYAQYLQITPFNYLAYSNLYLDIWLELGVVGFAAFVSTLIWTGNRLLRADFYPPAVPAKASAAPGENGRPFQIKAGTRQGWVNGRLWFLRDMHHATLAAFVALLLYGLTDDALFSGMGTPLLFFVSAVAVVVTRRRRSTRRLPSWVSDLSTPRRVQVAGLLLILLGALIFIRGDILAADWLANRAALAMARLDLEGWPRERWDDGSRLDSYIPLQADLMRSVTLAPNRTAYYRLGLIAMLARDYDSARDHLQQSLALDPGHRGTRKQLGYSYAWLGEYQQAAGLLREMPEVRQEMNVYTNWWRRHGRPDLAGHAAVLSDMLAAPRNFTD